MLSGAAVSVILLSIESIKLIPCKYKHVKVCASKSVPGIYSFPLYCYLTRGLDKASLSKPLLRRILASPRELLIGSNISDLRDDNDSGKAGFFTTVPLLLPNLLVKVLLLVIEEKLDYSMPELAGIDGVLLLGATGNSELDCRYCRIVFWGLVIWMLGEDNNEEEITPLRSLSLERIFDLPLAF